MRDKIWKAVCSKIPEGAILPRWAMTVRAALYPLDTLFWHMSKTRGYRWQNDTWLIEGITYSGAMMRLLANSDGGTYRVASDGRSVTMTIVKTADAALNEIAKYEETSRIVDGIAKAIGTPATQVTDDLSRSTF